jgi:Zn-dependent protease/CBS domain-containing protein
MTGSIRLGRILGLEIDLHYSWFIVFALFALILVTSVFPRQLPGLPAAERWAIGIITALVFFASLLLHEMAHSLVARANGIEISGITLFLFGGVSRIRDEPPSAAVELKVAAAGPATSLGLAAVFAGLRLLAQAGGWGAPVVVALGWLAVINLALAAFNLLPGFPLDGGRLLRAIIWHFTGSLRQASRIASLSGQGFGYLLMAWGFFLIFGGNWVGGIWAAFIGWFLVDAARSGYQQVIFRRALSGVPVGSIMSTDPAVVPAGISIQEAVDGYFLRLHFAAFPLVGGGEVRGIVGFREIREVPRESWSTTPVEQVARPVGPQDVLSPGDDSWHALARMATTGAGRLLVMEGTSLVGIVSRTDIMRHLRARLELDI